MKLAQSILIQTEIDSKLRARPNAELGEHIRIQIFEWMQTIFSHSLSECRGNLSI